jgi:uncharacterized protein
MIEIEVESIRSSTLNNQHVVMLKEKAGELYLPIWIGSAEADAIAIKIQGAASPRPRSHDLMHSIISAMGATIDYVLLNEIKGDTFYARIRLNVNGNAIEIDCRPSDAIALALRAGTPIYAAETVLKEGGMRLDEETGKPIILTINEDKAIEEKISPEELKRLSAFRNFIDKIDLDDLGKNKP